MVLNGYGIHLRDCVRGDSVGRMGKTAFGPNSEDLDGCDSKKLVARFLSDQKLKLG